MPSNEPLHVPPPETLADDSAVTTTGNLFASEESPEGFTAEQVKVRDLFGSARQRAVPKRLHPLHVLLGVGVFVLVAVTGVLVLRWMVHAVGQPVHRTPLSTQPAPAPPGTFTTQEQ